MTTPKTPGWGLRILKVRSTNGTPEALILPPDHEAPFWADLRQIAQHKARWHPVGARLVPPSVLAAVEAWLQARAAVEVAS